MDQQKSDLVLEVIGKIEKDIEENKVTLVSLADSIKTVENHLSNKHYFWDTIGKILAGLCSGGAIATILLKIFGVF